MRTQEQINFYKSQLSSGGLGPRDKPPLPPGHPDHPEKNSTRWALYQSLDNRYYPMRLDHANLARERQEHPLYTAYGVPKEYVNRYFSNEPLEDILSSLENKKRNRKKNKNPEDQNNNNANSNAVNSAVAPPPLDPEKSKELLAAINSGNHAKLMTAINHDKYSPNSILHNGKTLLEAATESTHLNGYVMAGFLLAKGATPLKSSSNSENSYTLEGFNRARLLDPTKPPRQTHNGWEYWDKSVNNYLPNQLPPAQFYKDYLPGKSLEKFYGKNVEQSSQPTYEEFKQRMFDQGVLPEKPPINKSGNFEYFMPLNGRYVGERVRPDKFYNAPNEFIGRFFKEGYKNPAEQQLASIQQKQLEEQGKNIIEGAKKGDIGPIRVTPTQVQNLLAEARERHKLQNIRDQVPTEIAPASLNRNVDQKSPPSSIRVVPQNIYNMVERARSMAISPYALNAILEQQQPQEHFPLRPRRDITQNILHHFSPEQYNPEYYPEGNDYD
jgi:hypothetical protein